MTRISIQRHGRPVVLALIPDNTDEPWIGDDILCPALNAHHARFVDRKAENPIQAALDVAKDVFPALKILERDDE